MASASTPRPSEITAHLAASDTCILYLASCPHSEFPTEPRDPFQSPKQFSRPRSPTLCVRVELRDAFLTFVQLTDQRTQALDSSFRPETLVTIQPRRRGPAQPAASGARHASGVWRPSVESRESREFGPIFSGFALLNSSTRRAAGGPLSACRACSTPFLWACSVPDDHSSALLHLRQGSWQLVREVPQAAQSENRREVLEWRSRMHSYSCFRLTPHLHAAERREALDKLKLKRYCCRRMIMTHVDLIDKLLNYNCECPRGAPEQVARI